MLGFEDLEDDSRNVVQNAKVCELVVRDHQVTLTLIEDQKLLLAR